MHKTLSQFKSTIRLFAGAVVLSAALTSTLQAGRNGFVEIEFDSQLKAPASKEIETSSSSSTSTASKRAENFAFTSTIMGQMGGVERPVQADGSLSKIRAAFLIGDYDAITTYEAYKAAQKFFIHTATLYSKDDVRIPGSFEAPHTPPAAPTKTFPKDIIDAARSAVKDKKGLVAAAIIKQKLDQPIEDARAIVHILEGKPHPAQRLALPEEIAAPFHCVITGELALSAIDPNDDQFYPGEINTVCLQHFSFDPQKASDVDRIHISLDGVVASKHPMAYLDILTTAQIFGTEGRLLQRQSNQGLTFESSLPKSLSPSIPFPKATTWVKLAFVNRTSTPDKPFTHTSGIFHVSEFWTSFFLGEPPTPLNSTVAFEKYKDQMHHVPLGQDTDIQISLLKEGRVTWHQLFTARFKNETGTFDRRMLLSDIIVNRNHLSPIQSVTTELFAAVPPPETVKERMFDLVTQTREAGILETKDAKTGSTTEKESTFTTRSHVGDENNKKYYSSSSTTGKQESEGKDDI